MQEACEITNASMFQLPLFLIQYYYNSKVYKLLEKVLFVMRFFRILLIFTGLDKIKSHSVCFHLLNLMTLQANQLLIMALCPFVHYEKA